MTSYVKETASFSVNFIISYIYNFFMRLDVKYYLPYRRPLRNNSFAT